MKINIYTCHFGNGHYKAADFIKEQLDADHETKIIDLYEEIFPNMHEWVYDFYRDLMQKQNLLYHLFLKVDGVKEKVIPQLTFLKNRFFDYLDSRPVPDIFIATYSLSAYFLGLYKQERGLTTPLITCVTDFMAHEFWMNDYTDLYLVASPFTKAHLLQGEVQEEQILVYGLGGQSKGHIERNFEGPLKILVTGGGLGLLPKEIQFYTDLRDRYHAELRVICGKNTKIKRKLDHANLKNVYTFGFVTNMEEQLEWADIFVGKAGGLSTFEAIQWETPILYLPPFLPQEKRNARFIEKSKIGLSIQNNLSAFSQFDDLIFSQFRENMRKMKSELEPEAFLDHIETIEKRRNA